MTRHVRERLYALLEASPESTSPAAARLRLALTVLIAVSTVVVIVETVPAAHALWPAGFRAVELVAVAIFSAEYLLRLYACTADPAYRHPVVGRLRFALRPLMLLDLLAVLPFFLTFFLIDLRAVRVLRLLRLLRIAKLGRYSVAFGTIGAAARARAADLAVTLSLVAALLVLAATLMHAAEHEAQPEAFGTIPAAMWWAVMTITTVGYGDVYPVTGAGRVLAAAVAVLGIAMFALPTSIFAAEFLNQLQRKRGAEQRCPHCGELLEPGQGREEGRV